MLSEGKLSFKSLKNLLSFIKSKGMKIDDLPEAMFKERGIPKYFKRFIIKECRGNPSWEGLIVGFPGNIADLSTENVGTPFLRMILYPIIHLYLKRAERADRKYLCLYLLGVRFNDVFLRKFRFFDAVIPHVIILTEDLRKCVVNHVGKSPVVKEDQINEAYLQKSLCDQMLEEKGIRIPVDEKKSIDLDLISYEVPAAEGTKNPERLDILGYDLKDHSLVAFEIKGPNPGTLELNNLFLQGMEHRDWLEKNKMAVKFAFDGPNGKRINTRKRVRLLLGFCGEVIPKHFVTLRENATRKDRFLNIDFCRLVPPDLFGNKVRVARFEEGR
jgi:hypothetical protein